VLARHFKGSDAGRRSVGGASSSPQIGQIADWREVRAGAECRGTPVPFAGQWNGEPVTEVETDLGRIVLWWDTGTPLSILTTRIAQPTWPEVKEGPVTSRRLWVGGKDFGPWTFEVVNLTLPPGFEGFLGHDFYAKHVVCMDFPNKKLLVRKS